MFEKRRLMREAAAFDGERKHSLDSPPGRDTTYVAELRQLRKGVRDAASGAPEVTDAQMGAFLEGIREGLSIPVRRRYPFWTAVSVAAAALIIALALLSILYPGTQPVKANTVESVSTDLNGATVDWYDNKEGVTTVWVKTSGDDVW